MCSTMAERCRPQSSSRRLYLASCPRRHAATWRQNICAFTRQADPEPVRRAAASAQASVRQRAAALLKLLGSDDAASAPHAAQPSPVGDLMGGIDEAAPAAAAQPSTQDLLGAAALSSHLALPFSPPFQPGGSFLEVYVTRSSSWDVQIGHCLLICSKSHVGSIGTLCPHHDPYFWSSASAYVLLDACAKDAMAHKCDVLTGRAQGISWTRSRRRSRAACRAAFLTAWLWGPKPLPKRSLTA